MSLAYLLGQEVLFETAATVRVSTDSCDTFIKQAETERTNKLG
jgi:hypothetical protein